MKKGDRIICISEAGSLIKCGTTYLADSDVLPEIDVFSNVGMDYFIKVVNLDGSSLSQPGISHKYFARRFIKARPVINSLTKVL